MKKFYPNCHLWLVPLLLATSCPRAVAQKEASPIVTPLMADQITFIVHAPVDLPSLLKERQYQKMKYFLVNWNNAEYPSPELIFAAEALLAMETGKISSFSLPCNCLHYLADYAKELKEIETPGTTFRYYLKLEYPYYYDATDNARQTILFLQSWAAAIRKNQAADSTASFICRTISGEIADPTAQLKAFPQSCPRIVQAQKNLDTYTQIDFIDWRNASKGTAAVLMGWWFPTGHLGEVLGSHPSIGVQLGYRTKRNEYDITWNIRFLYPTPRPYTFVRQDSIYTSNYYDGGYIGFEYSRYFIHQKRIDLGYTTGIAYDYFSVADGWSDQHRETNIVPLNVGSFDLNYGLRFKYFIHRRAFVGLTAKYHLIHYNNDGGTDLTGNAYTLDILFGSN
jgi:hypothetical protein